MTNGDKIRSMTDEALAEWINNMINEGDEVIGFCQSKKVCRDMLDTEDGIPISWCSECLLDWVRRDIDE